MLKCLLSLTFILFFTGFASSQDFTGQWKGTFIDKSTAYVGLGGDKCDYVLELEVNGNQVTGYSYTYFSDAGKKYYTICSLTGFINKAEKYIEVKEIVRTKTNVPRHIRNCFQVHKLHYEKGKDSESLEGTWIPAPNQENDCGYGTTTLERRLLKLNTPVFNNAAARNVNTPKPNRQPVPLNNKKPTVAVPKQNPARKPEVTLNSKKEQVQETVEIPVTKNNMPGDIRAPRPDFEKRDNSLLKTIEVKNASVKVSLYDNGEIDGDSISLFYNGKLLLSRQRLSDKPIVLNINVEKDNSVNELVMYAENLGTIPPNTALMIVNDGPNRYEVRITSDLQKSGTIRFVLKDDKPRGTAP